MMNTRNIDISMYVATGVLILTFFTFVYLDNFLLFHTLAELFSVIIGLSVFIITWNSRKFISNRYILYLGIAFLFISLLDILHLLSYRGMPFFQQHGNNLPTQLWIVSRYMLAITFFSAPVMMRYRINIYILFTGFLLITTGVVFLIFTGHFPVCYVDGTGLTAFKKMSEYIICLIFTASVFTLLYRRKSFDRNVLTLIVSSIIFTILSELCFTLYVNVYGFFSFAGHFLKITAFLFFYRAIIVTGLKSPYSLLFRELDQQREEYRSLFKNMTDGFARHRIITNEKGEPEDYVFIDVNNAFEDITGLKKENIIGKRLTEVIPGIEKDPADWIGKYGAVALTGKGLKLESYTQDLNRWFSITAYSTKKGSFATIFQDITDRKQIEITLEKKVKERTDELEKRNRELQDFSFIASHDLQEPLRKIRVFGDMISEKIKAGLYEQVMDYISRMQSSAERMQNLLMSLLAYSRVTASQRPFDRIDLSMVLVETLSNLEILIKEKEAVIEIVPLGSIEADAIQISQLFQNLIENALKFHKPSSVPHIKIHSAQNDDNLCVITVEDEGIGFNMEYLSKIFIPFQRLHGRNEYAGTGMGLAICKKIVERHGGQLTARSEPGKGTSFVISLPVTHQ